eukprot:COSAG01_NODE_9151_length_2536_cov_2.627000_1_plen_25_part_10
MHSVSEAPWVCVHVMKLGRLAPPWW